MHACRAQRHSLHQRGRRMLLPAMLLACGCSSRPRACFWQVRVLPCHPRNALHLPITSGWGTGRDAGAVTLWGTRLAGYLFWRVLHTGKDARLNQFFPKDDMEPLFTGRSQ